MHFNAQRSARSSVQGDRRRTRLLWLIGTLFVGVVVLSVAVYWFVFRPHPARLVWESAPAAIRLVPIASGFSRPVTVVRGPDEGDAFYVLEQAGRILRVNSGGSTPTLFLDLTAEVEDTHIEQGLYSLAFDPGYDENGAFYVSYTAKPDGRLVVSRFTVGPGVAGRVEPVRHVLLEIPSPTPGHFGLQLGFGPDGLLYISVGDGQETGRTLAPQDLGSLHGKILRINPIDFDSSDSEPSGSAAYTVPADNPFVGTPGARPEVWAYGFRNPFRFSFDRVDDNLWVGDVGNNSSEEIDLVKPGGNYGWPLAEGREKRFRALAGNILDGHITSVFRIISDQLFRPTRRAVAPVMSYRHLVYDPEGGNTVIGGQVYHGPAIPELRGYYVFGDWVSGRIWALQVRNGTTYASVLLDTAPDGLHVSSFGEGADGELYLTDYSGGAVLKIVPAVSAIEP